LLFVAVYIYEVYVDSSKRFLDSSVIGASLKKSLPRESSRGGGVKEEEFWCALLVPCLSLWEKETNVFPNASTSERAGPNIHDLCVESWYKARRPIALKR
jgi:hypothetical protein